MTTAVRIAPTAFMVDYMTLLKDDGRWVIIARSFQTTPNALP
jgi:Putative lumazine-binding